ncbi:MAG: YdcF family protein [Oculatellaceae cyanobacterium Prado106]|jgi:hypothetical protein|nr:YdcF family protein [Oculatellaceae cyanobacterium Prado106]
MFELITQIIILAAIYFLVRFVLLSFIERRYLTWLGGVVLVLLLVLAFLEPTNRTVGLLWGILSFPLRPLGLVLVLLAYAMRKGTKAVMGPQVMAALLILLISSLPVTAYLLTAQSEQRTVSEVAAQQDAVATRGVSAIVVLGDGSAPTDPTYRIRAQLNTSEDGISVSQRSRLLYAAQLYNTQVNRGNDPLVIVSVGPRPLEQDGVSETTAITDVLIGNGVPRDRIRVDLEGVDPRTSAVVTQRLLASGEAAVRVPVILIAPALNIRRATSTFAKLNFEVVPRPTDFYVFQLQSGVRLAAASDLIPSAEALVITTRVIDEYLSTVYYFLRGWLVDPLGL